MLCLVEHEKRYVTSGLVKQERNNLGAIFSKKEIATVSNLKFN